MAPFTESGLGEAAPARVGEDAERQGRRPKPVYAALDLGTNNCRLLVATPTAVGFTVIDAFSRIVRLGEGLGSNNRLGEDAIRRTIAALRICRDKMRARRVTRSHLIATQACRMAENGPRFVERVKRELDLALDIVDQRTEAHLAAAGCAALADPLADNLILFDIGGGSSEIVWLDKAGEGRPVSERIRAWASLPIGVVTLAERHGGVSVTDSVFEAMVAEVDRALSQFKIDVAPLARCKNFHLLGTSGTVTTVAGVFLGLQRYERRRVDGLWMRRSEVDSVMASLRAMSYEDRAANGCIGRDRADLVLAGCAILEAIRRAFPSERLRVADRGLREGLLTQMMAADRVWTEATA
ncbi:MAG: exopolyphosphatase [Rhizobiales bacterium 65-9]|nr:Ppx/GppA family phosphatase [Hyphomicrobiales bacterium]OJY32159.1 MAG: exopolyphosphatase [Rhizobiales bacterium 65-9]